MTEGNNIGTELSAGLRRLTYATIALWMIVVTLGGVGYADSDSKGDAIRSDATRAARESARTTTALCVLRHNLATRVAGSKAFLEEHPQGIPGITPAAIKRGMANERETVKALGILKCPPVK